MHLSLLLILLNLRTDYFCSPTAKDHFLKQQCIKQDFPGDGEPSVYTLNAPVHRRHQVPPLLIKASSVLMGPPGLRLFLPSSKTLRGNSNWHIAETLPN
jgi:hypothetical protein